SRTLPFLFIVSKSSISSFIFSLFFFRNSLYTCMFIFLRSTSLLRVCLCNVWSLICFFFSTAIEQSSSNQLFRGCPSSFPRLRLPHWKWPLPFVELLGLYHHNWFVHSAIVRLWFHIGCWFL